MSTEEKKNKKLRAHGTGRKRWRPGKNGGGKWNIEVPLGLGPDMKYRYKSVTHKTSKGADRLAAQVQAQYGYRDDMTEIEKLTVSDLMDEWWAEYTDERKRSTPISTSTRNRYIYDMKTLRPLIGHLKVMSVRSRDIKHAIYARDASWSASGMRRVLLNQIFKYALEEEYVQNNPVAGVPKPALKGRKGDQVRKHFNEEELKQILALIEETKSWIKPMFLIQLLTATRVGEVFALRWSDIDFEKRTITIAHTVDWKLKPYAFGPTKAGNTSVLPMTDSAYEVLKQQKEQQQAKQAYRDVLTEAELEVGQQITAKYWNENDLVFPNQIGELESYFKYVGATKKVIADAGVDLQPRTVTHRIRHTASSILYSQNSSSARVAEFLGNTTDTAEKYYKSFQEGSMDDLAKTIDSFVTNLNQ